MFNALLTRIFGSRNDRVVRGMRKTVARINELEASFQALSDAELRAKTDEFRKRLADGQSGWVFAESVLTAGDLNTVPVINDIQPPPTTTP